MNPRSREDDLDERELELLVELLDGDPAQDRDAVERTGASPRVRARLAELRAVEGELAAEGAAARAEAVETARAAGPVPGEERALAALERAMERGPAPARRSAARPAWWLIAAATLALVWFARGLFLPSDGGEGPGRGVLLGDPSTEGFAPSGRVFGFEAFVWAQPAPAGSVQRVRAWPGSSAAGRPPIESPDLEETTRWTPSPEERSRLGARFVWRVVAIDALGRTDESPTVSVEIAP